jgi:hypothetical protein
VEFMAEHHFTAEGVADGRWWLVKPAHTLANRYPVATRDQETAESFENQLVHVRFWTDRSESLSRRAGDRLPKVTFCLRRAGSDSPTLIQVIGFVLS